MSPRPRSRRNKDLPANLYRANSGKSFQYRHPVTGKLHGVGSDKAEAVKAAKQLNGILMGGTDLVGTVLGKVTVQAHIDWMRENSLPEREYAASTLEMYEIRWRQMVAAFGGKGMDEVTVKDMADLMEGKTPRVANQVRQVAGDTFKVAIARGLMDHNPSEATLKRREKKQRKRLTLAQFKSIRALAPDWLVNAMSLALITLQRREDIVNIKFTDIRDDALYVIQHKTQKYDTGYLKIRMTPELDKVLKKCRDDLASPFVIHRRPQRKVKWDGQEHWTQIKPEMATRTFKEIAEKVESIKAMPEEERPSFHEIRALGIKLYKDAGADPQQLAGHATAKMTKNYDADHDEIRWVEVTADLKVI
ncbi:phage integrase Arm DNA-binding domain-containing protein [Marinobacterium rhizophilum]|uniref:phage integrase Arm DNA-binding domain-containing protein n=1 Tax=Marinobacterium rhizophilum TaxID=420402 RepID=UPI0003652DD7|nr:phage integrase Arm DNA-binding domain-containing protein [Marinobacterium rhizophilum]